MAPKNKRAKTSHHPHSHSQTSNNKNTYQHREEARELLSEAEIWDDRALVRTWEEAVKEYEFYHSLASRGLGRGNLELERVLDEVEREDGEGGDEEKGDVEEGEIDEDVTAIEPNLTNGENLQHGSGSGNEIAKEGSGEQRTPSHNPPESTTQKHASGDVGVDAASVEAATQEQTSLDNLKMAYYWAGYYSGLHDGQQKQKQNGS